MQAPNVVLSPVGGCANRRAEARFWAPDCNCDAGENYSGNDNGSRLTAPLLGIPEIPFWRDNVVFVEKILKLFRTGFLEALIEPGCLFGVYPASPSTSLIAAMACRDASSAFGSAAWVKVTPFRASNLPASALM